MTPEQQKKQEQYLYKIVRRVLSWTKQQPEEEEIWNLIMLELVNIKP